MRKGGNCLNYVKRGWNRKRGRGNKDFKKGCRLGQGEGALKGWGGDWNPLTNCDYFPFNASGTQTWIFLIKVKNLLIIPERAVISSSNNHHTSSNIL